MKLSEVVLIERGLYIYYLKENRKYESVVMTDVSDYINYYYVAGHRIDEKNKDIVAVYFLCEKEVC